MKKIVTLLTILLCSNLVLGQDSTFVGYATSKIKNGNIDIHTFGFKNKEQNINFDSLTIQPIGSVSKTVIGLAIMKAIELGLIDLDTDINNYIDFKVQNPRIKNNTPITLRHLATHTSGILDNEKYYLQAYTKGLKPNLSLEQYLKEYLVKKGKKYSKKNFGNFKAGDEYNYSNIGAALAAYIIERVSQQSFDVFTQKYIFQPLGMKNTSWHYDETKLNSYSKLYDENDRPLEYYSLATYPDGSLKTTIADLSIYLNILINGYNTNSTFLEKKSWNTFYQKNFTANYFVRGINPKEPNTGIFIIYSKNGTIGHTGSDPGVAVVMYFDPLNNEGKIFMANEDLTPQNVQSFKEIWSKL